MLVELRILNFALIEQLHIEFQPGFTVLTGETGAGKSLLIDAIDLLVGGRASTDQIRTGEDEAKIEASFVLPDAHPLLRHLRSQDMVGSNDREIVLKRVLSRSGRSRMYLNGDFCPLRVLEDLGGTLVDIHGQHEQQSLLSSSRQLDAVDGFGGLVALRAQYEETYRLWKDRTAALEATIQEGLNHERLRELLQFQSEEIERAGLSTGEEEALQAERQRLVHAHRLRELAETAYGDLQAEEQGVLGKLGRINRVLEELAQIDQSSGEGLSQAREASVLLKDLADSLRDYALRLEADPERQSLVEDRLDAIHRLKKKYGGSIEAVLATGSRVKQELFSIATQEGRVSELTRQVQVAEEQMTDLAIQLSKKRRDAAKRLATLVAAELGALKMEGAKFEIALSADEGISMCGPTGWDQVEFLLSSNVGEPRRPLARIASGGELSRIMLALKSVLAETDHVPVLVFDEIDMGVGGGVASAMGTRLRRLGQYHQVFCITHLPQVASQAEHHLLVEKGRDRRRTTTSIRLLKGVGREEEIARMLGGQTITRKVRETAAELIAETKSKQ
ncbi:DNA repair protein RecN [Petrachloros mirabilis]